MTSFIFNAEKRIDFGRGASRRLRRGGDIPAILYGSGEPPVSLCLNHDKFISSIGNDEVFTSIVNLEIDGERHDVLIKDLQCHPFANKVLHVDFQRVSSEQRICKQVPFKVINADSSPAVRLGALLTLLIANIEVRCKAKDLPNFIEIDCSKLEENTSLKLSELDIPKGLELVPLLKGGSEFDHAVVIVGKER